MCFTLSISLSTAVFEFALALFMLFFFRKSTVRNFLALFVFMLGLYQLTEFMICSGFNLEFWARTGFIVYTFLPAIGFHFVQKLRNKKFVLAYIPPVAFSIFALLPGKFVVEGICEKFFVTIRTVFFHGNGIVPMYLYWLYYLGYLLAICFISIMLYRQRKRAIYLLITGAVLVSLVSAWIFIIIFPSFSIQFPSIYCEFAVLTALLAFIGCAKDSSIKRN